MELIAPDGASVHKAKVGGSFGNGKYFVGTDLGPPAGTVQRYTDKYDFKGREPSEAMAEEVWDKFIRGLPYGNWPRTVRKRDGKYETIRNVTLQPPPLVKGK